MTKSTDIINFGKYKGKSFEEISDIDPSYILWLHENVEHVKFKKEWIDAVQWDLMEMDEMLMDVFESFAFWND